MNHSLVESHYYVISAPGQITAYSSPQEAIAALQPADVLWLDYCPAVKDQLDELVGLLDINPLNIEDCLDDNQVPKIEDFGPYTFIIVNAFNYANRTLSIDEINMFIGHNYLITVSGRNTDHRRPLREIERIVRRNIANASKGPAFLMHTVLDYIVDQKFVTIEAMEDELDAAEESMLADLSTYKPGELLRLRRGLLSLRKSLFHERELLVKICRRDCDFITDEVIYQYRDVYHHLAKFFELTEGYRDVVTSLMEMYLSMLNNQMNRVANQTNQTVRRLTFITTIFMPLSLLAGIGGMSEWSMMTGPDNWRLAYPAFLALLAILGIASYFVLRWLERRQGSGI